MYDEYVGARGSPALPKALGAVLNACARAGDLSTALRVFREGVAAGVRSNAVLLNALLLGCARHGETMATLQGLLQQMQQEGVPRPGTVYLQLIEARAHAAERGPARDLMWHAQFQPLSQMRRGAVQGRRMRGERGMVVRGAARGCVA